MGTRKVVIITAVISSLVTFMAFLPMISFPGVARSTASSCGHETGQIKELERYGSVTVKYDTPPSYQRELGKWYASFSTSYHQEVQISADARKPTLCEAVDTLYYKVMEYPMKPVND